jgi:hypothetical protein
MTRRDPTPQHPLLKPERHKLTPAAKAGLYKFAGVRKHKPKDKKV